MTSRRGFLLVPAAALLLACGGGPDPAVTFSAGGASAVVGPSRYCDVEITECSNDPEAVAVLPVPAGTPVKVSVPEAVAETPWQVVFRYRQAEETTDGRTEVFAAGERQDYTLLVPEGGQLVVAEVQQFGAPAITGGEPTFRIRASWLLSVDGR